MCVHIFERTLPECSENMFVRIWMFSDESMLHKLTSQIVYLAIFSAKPTMALSLLSRPSLTRFPLNNSLLGRLNNELHLSPRQVAEHRKANVSHYPSTCDLCQAAE